MSCPRLRISTAALALTAALMPLTASAHGPLFSFSPHTLYKNGVEMEESFFRDAVKGQALDLYETRLRYGVTGDWTVGLQLPYVNSSLDTPGTLQGTGFGDLQLLTQYRFWRHDSLGVQRSAAFVGNLKLDTAGPKQGTGSTDFTGGLVYGYESIHWYHWASAGYRYHGEGPDGFRRGGTVLLNLVGGWRPRMPVFGQADTVFVVGLNAELTAKSTQHGRSLPDTGGNQLFVSPGLIWTNSTSHFALRPGVQIPIYSDLNGNQPRTSYRATLQLEYHF